MLRRANNDETAAFRLVERTVQRAQPRVGMRGLESLNLPTGTIERSALGRLRFRFNGNSSDYSAENPRDDRPASKDEVSLWNSLERLIALTGPIADAQGNLQSMRMGPRFLSRLATGGVVTSIRNGTAPFRTSIDVSAPPEPKAPTPRAFGSQREALLLAAIDAFIRQGEGLEVARSRRGLTAGRGIGRPGYHGASSPLTRTRKHTRGRWHKCPICRTPVVKGRYNPWILHRALRAGSGAIRDLRGGYLSRLRETYLIQDPKSVIESFDPEGRYNDLWDDPDIEDPLIEDAALLDPR